MLSRIWIYFWCLQLDYISKENKGYFDEDSMDEFIVLDFDEIFMSLSFDDYMKKKKKGKKGKKDSSLSGSGSDNDVEVIKVWNLRFWGGGEGNVDEIGNNFFVFLKLEENIYKVFIICLDIRRELISLNGKLKKVKLFFFLI